MKHTPGPWEISKTCEVFGEQLGIKRINSWGYHIWQNESDIEAEANARLIAAAPEMLEALKEALLELCVCADRLGTDITTFASYNMVKKSIAKAEGR